MDESGVMRGDAVTVTPAECILAGVEADVRHVMTVVVKNVSLTGRRVRMVPPRSPCFRLAVKNDIELAPGLEMRAEISYLCDRLQDLDDKMLRR